MTEQRKVPTPTDLGLTTTAPTPEELELVAVDPSTSFAAGAIQGATFGFADEIGGAAEVVSSALSSTTFSEALNKISWKAYEESRDKYRKQYKSAQKANPLIYMTGEAAGSVPMSLLLPGAGFATAGRLVRAGAAGGAAYSAGVTEEEKLADQLAEVGTGATMGAVGAAALVGVGRSLSGVIKYVKTSKAPPVIKNRVGQIAAENARNNRPLSKGELAQLEGALSDPSLKIHQKFLNAAAELPELTESAFTTGARDGQFIRFSLFKAADEPLDVRDVKAFYKQWKHLNESAQLELYNQFRKVQVMKSVVTKALNKTVGVEDPLKLRALRYFEDPYFLSHAVDEKLGTNWNGVLMGFKEAEHRMSLDAAPFLDRLSELQEGVSKHFADSPELIRRALENPDAVRLTTDQQLIVSSWKKLFKDLRTHFNSKGLNIRELQNYYPHRYASSAEIHKRLSDIMKNTDWSANEAFMEAVSFLANKRKLTDVEVQRVVDGILDPEFVKKTLSYRATSAFQRVGKLPELLQEDNALKVTVDYIASNMKAVHYDPVFRQAQLQMVALTGARDHTGKLLFPKAEAYFSKYLKQMSGEPSFVDAWARHTSDRFSASMQSIIDNPDAWGITKAVAKFGQVTPTFMGWLHGRMYANLLGYNIHAPIRNMSQSWALTAPELGGSYGFKLVAKAWLRGLKDFKRGISPSKVLQERGLLGVSFEGEAAVLAARDAMLEELPAQVRRSMRVVEKIDEKLGMALYTQSDTYNRYFTVKAAQEWTSDVLAQRSNALRVLDKLPAGLKAEVRTAVRGGDRAAVEKLLQDWLIAKTQFNYGKSNLTEFGRDFGRVASMFMKWTVMVGGDIHYLGRTGRWGELTLKYLAPTAAVAAAHQALKDMEAYDDGAVQLILGRSVMGWSPASSVLGVSPPPLVQAIGEVSDATLRAVEGDPEGAAVSTFRALRPMIPAVVPGSVATQRASRIISEEE